VLFRSYSPRAIPSPVLTKTLLPHGKAKNLFMIENPSPAALQRCFIASLL